MTDKNKKEGKTFWDFASEVKASYDRANHPEWFETPEEREEREERERKKNIKLIIGLGAYILMAVILWMTFYILTR